MQVDTDKTKFLQQEITELKNQLEILQLSTQIDNKQAKTRLLDDNFLRRSFAVLGHSLIAQAIILVPVGLIILLLYLFGIIG